MKKLTSSRLFGELIRSEEPGFKVKTEYLSFYERLRNNFDDFLSQKLELWMFVPCKLVEGVWVVLEEPKCECFTEYDREGCYEKCYEYINAKNRVLFEGFETRLQGQEIMVVTLDNSNVWVTWNDSKTIEDLVYLKPVLTPTAQKQIGL